MELVFDKYGSWVAWWHNKLILCLCCWCPIWSQVHILAVPLPTQLPTYGLEEKRETDKVFEALHPRGKLGRLPIPTLCGLSSGLCGSVQSEALSVLCLNLYKNKQTNNNNKPKI